MKFSVVMPLSAELRILILYLNSFIEYFIDRWNSKR